MLCMVVLLCIDLPLGSYNVCFWLDNSYKIFIRYNNRDLHWRIDHHGLVKAQMVLEFGVWGENKVYNLFLKFHYKRGNIFWDLRG